MKLLLNHIGHTTIQLIIFITVITMISITSVYGQKTLIGHIGETISSNVDEDGFTTESGIYVDSENSKSLAGASPEIHIISSPKKGVEINYTDFISVTEGTDEIPFYIVSVEDDIKGTDAVEDNTVEFDRINHTLKFVKRGTYRIHIRAEGTAITRKSFVYTITK